MNGRQLRRVDTVSATGAIGIGTGLSCSHIRDDCRYTISCRPRTRDDRCCSGSRIPLFRDESMPMTSRQILTTALTALFLMGAAATAGASTTKKPLHHMPVRHGKVLHSKMTRHARMASRHQGDSQNAAVDRLNAQSLQRASSGAGAMPMNPSSGMPMNSGTPMNR